MTAANIAQLKSAMIGPIPGRVNNGVGQLPQAWRLVSMAGLVVTVDEFGQDDRGRDYVELSLSGKAVGTGPFEIQFGRSNDTIVAVNDRVRQIHLIAGMAGSRRSVTKTNFGLNGYDANGSYMFNQWTNIDLSFDRSQQLKRFVHDWTITDATVRSVHSKVGIWVANGGMVEFTLRFGWHRLIVNPTAADDDL